MMRRLILGTAGHIDHGKTQLVRALTGVDTDRLKEEKERGITIDLGFAELSVSDELRLGVVDVPGHEGFIRNMLAGATGMDLVLLIVAADEGVMPQTREHLAIVSLLGVERLVVALTKVDLVDADWCALVADEVRSLLSGTAYDGSPLVRTSARTGEGLADLVSALAGVADQIRAEDPRDVARLPVDRVFTVRGTGTVVTGTLWSGTLRVGERVRVLPGELSARIRGLQVHGRDVEEASAGERTAAALAGAGLDRQSLARGHVLVSGDGWAESTRLTARVRVLPDAEWALERGQRVRVHLGTAELMARLMLLGPDALLPGEQGWAQLRLESAALARTGERFVVRSYSPVTTIGGGVIVEPTPPKRTALTAEEQGSLEALLGGSAERAVAARAELAGWSGEARARLPITAGVSEEQVDALLSGWPLVTEPGNGTRDRRPRLLAGTLFSPEVVAEGSRLLESALDAFHRTEPLRPGIELEAFRQALPPDAHPGLADGLLARLVASGEVVLAHGAVARPDFRVRLSDAQQRLLASLLEVYRGSALAPPALAELPSVLRESPHLWPLLRILEADGRLTRLDDELFIWSEALAGAARRVAQSLGGRTDLGPADFKDALPVTRKHLLPILAHFDHSGVTLRRGSVREVPGG
jgi:selenocysteine-specific elongation factor